MSDYLTNLIARTASAAPWLAPRLPSRFESAAPSGPTDDYADERMPPEAAAWELTGRPPEAPIAAQTEPPTRAPASARAERLLAAPAPAPDGRPTVHDGGPPVPWPAPEPAQPTGPHEAAMPREPRAARGESLRPPARHAPHPLDETAAPAPTGPTSRRARPLIAPREAGPRLSPGSSGTDGPPLPLAATVADATGGGAPVASATDRVSREPIPRLAAPRPIEPLAEPLPDQARPPSLALQPLLPYPPPALDRPSRREPEAAQPTIQISIGRVEVRAAKATPPPRSEPRRPAVMPLEEYLRARRGGG